MLDLYVFNYSDDKEYNLDLNKLNQEVLDHVLRMNDYQRDLSIFSYYQLIKLLKEVYQLDDFEFNFDSKPYLIDRPIYFNISHTDGAIAILISDQECGVDIENKYRSVRENLYKKVLSFNEQHIYQRREDNTCYFLECWVKKEAYLKYLGKGITTRMNEIDSENLSFVEIKEDGEYLIAVCSKAKDLKFVLKSEDLEGK